MKLQVFTPELSRADGMLQVSARIESEGLPDASSREIWYRIGEDSGLQLSGRADPFLLAASNVAMKLGIPLHVEGAVSTRLAHGLDMYQDIMTTWFPDIFQRVDIEYARLDDCSGQTHAPGVGCGFSGGLDSWAAVKGLLPGQMPFKAFQLTHAIMINGFDNINDPQRSGLSGKLYDVYSGALSQWGVDLAMIHTNQGSLRSGVLSRAQGITCFETLLAAVGHVLAPSLGRYNIAGHNSYRHEDMFPGGVHPAKDHLLSSDQLQVIHLGIQRTRTEKLEWLADDAPVRETLRVCFDTPEFHPETGEPLNCGACEKCVRTIVMLDIIGKLDQFPTFRFRDKLSRYMDPALMTHINPEFANDIKRLAQRHGRRDWLGIMRQSDTLRDPNKDRWSE